MLNNSRYTICNVTLYPSNKDTGTISPLALPKRVVDEPTINNFSDNKKNKILNYSRVKAIENNVINNDAINDSIKTDDKKQKKICDFNCTIL